MEIPQNIVPAMQSAVPPAGGPVAPDPSQDQIPTPEEKAAMVADLEKSGEDVQNKSNEVDAKILNSQQDLDSMRQEIIMNLFNTLKSHGVDPSSPESVRAFLEKLSEQDPDLFDMFEMAFNELSGVTDPQLEQQAQDASVGPVGNLTPADLGPEVQSRAGLMDRFKNLAPEVMRGDSGDIAPPPASPPGL
jgi:hypothetical protein